jgi:hypothetical protein
MHTFYDRLRTPAADPPELLARLARLTEFTLSQIVTIRTELGWVTWGQS